MPAAPLSRDRGGARGGQRGRGSGGLSQGFDAGYSTARQQVSRAPPASYDPYGGDNDELDWDNDGAEPEDHEHRGEQNMDESSYPDTY